MEVEPCTTDAYVTFVPVESHKVIPGKVSQSRTGLSLNLPNSVSLMQKNHLSDQNAFCCQLYQV